MRADQIRSEIDSLDRRIKRKKALATDESTEKSQGVILFREAKDLEAQKEVLEKRLKTIQVSPPSTTRTIQVTTRRSRLPR